MTPEALDDLVNYVKSKCASLIGAADLIRKSPDGERRELLALMLKAARELAVRLEKP